jgi:hypothetical protein
VKRHHLHINLHDPKQRRQAIMLVAVVILVVVYLRSRGGAGAASTDPSTDPNLVTSDGTSAATGPFAPEWPTTGNDNFGYGLGGGGGGGGSGSTGPPAAGGGGGGGQHHHHHHHKRTGYRAWLEAHPHASRRERIAALRRLIGQGRGNLTREAAILARLSRRQGAANAAPPPPHHGGGGHKPPGIVSPTVPVRRPGATKALPLVGAGVAGRPSSGIARAATPVQLAPVSTRHQPRHRADHRKRTVGVR